MADATPEKVKMLEQQNSKLLNLQNKIMLEASMDKSPPILPELPMNTHESVKKLLGKGYDQFISDSSYERGNSTLPSMHDYQPHGSPR